jgi:hypothetical protein
LRRSALAVDVEALGRWDQWQEMRRRLREADVAERGERTEQLGLPGVGGN